VRRYHAERRDTASFTVGAIAHRSTLSLGTWTMDLKRLVHRVRAIHLFSALGAEIKGSSIPRIRSWSDWAGPQDPLVEKIGLIAQSLHDAVIPASEDENWSRALRVVVQIGAEFVPYVESEDSWHAPSSAVWSAAWTYALEEVYRSFNISVPLEVVAQQYWYERGHWPCALVSDSSMCSEQGYVVF
jgi:hypothetical protein